MALTTCPECNHGVSDHAVTCPNCGFPLAQSQQPDLVKILCAGRWLAESGTLVDALLEAEFSPDYTFQGLTRPNPSRVAGLQMVAYANFQGRWQVAGSQLFLDFPLTMAGTSSQTQIAIQFTRVSADALSGVDKWLRGWEWQRVAVSAYQQHMDKQAVLSKMLTNIADMRHQMLEEVAKRLAEEEEAAGPQSGESRRKGRKKSAGT
jgi:zinc-ribbon domain